MTEEEPSTADDRRRVATKDMIDALRETGSAPGIGIGEPAPDFMLPAATGGSVALRSRLDDGPVVVVFYRGAWCPICNLHVKSLQAGLPEIRSRGASMIAISPEALDDSLSTAEALELGFDVLSDVDQTVIREWQLQFPIPEPVRHLFRSAGMGPRTLNARGTWHLPVPATFVVGTDGFIKARHVDPNYRERMTLADILKALDELSV